jgi:hypothetical protein
VLPPQVPELPQVKLERQELLRERRPREPERLLSNLMLKHGVSFPQAGFQLISRVVCLYGGITLAIILMGYGLRDAMRLSMSDEGVHFWFFSTDIRQWMSSSSRIHTVNNSRLSNSNLNGMSRDGHCMNGLAAIVTAVQSKHTNQD